MKKNTDGTEPCRVLDGLKDLFMVFSGGRVVYANGAATRLLGWTREQLLAKKVTELVAPPYDRTFSMRVKRLKAEGELFTRTAYRRRIGGPVTLNARYNISSISGRPCVLCVARQASKQDSRLDPGASGERYRRLIDGLRSEYFFFQHQPGRFFAYVSPSVKDVLGYTPEYFRRSYRRTLTSNPVNKGVISFTRGSVRGTQPKPYLVEARHKDGSIRWLEVANVPVRDEFGKVVSVEGIARDVTARVKSRQELDEYRKGLERLVEERSGELEAVFDRTPVLLLLLDKDLNVVRTNSPSRQGGLIGEVLRCVNARSGSCGLGRHCGSCPVRRAVSTTLRTGRPVNRSEAVLETAAGRKLYFLLSSSLIRKGGDVRLLLCCDDITLQKEAEASLRKAEEQRRLILSAAGDGIIGVDNNGEIMFMNEAAQAMLGWTMEELKGRNLHNVIHYKRPDGSPYPLEECPMFGAYTEKREMAAHDEMFWRRDGSGFYVRYSARPMFAGAEVNGAVVTFSDISERRRIETELRVNKERLQVYNAALTELGHGRKTATTDVDAAFREAAETAASALEADRVSVWLFNEDRSALVCRTMYDRASRSHSRGMALAAADYPSYFRLLEGERILVVDDAMSDFRVREFRDTYIRPNGVASLLEATIFSGDKTAGAICAERAGAPRPWGLDEQSLLGAVADFAALALSSAERARLESMKDFLTHTIVHDLKNPLSSIICAGEMLSAMKDKLPREQRDNLEILNAMAEEMRKMVSNILDINRIEEGKMPLRPDVFRPERLLKQAVESLKITVEHERKHIRLRASASAPAAYGDAGLLRRVLENLMANAIKFSPAGTDVEAGASASQGGGVEFYVRDHGPGIPEEYHERIFEKFVQLDDPSPRKWGGKGLGLAFCKLAVEAHGGSIRVESAPGKGSTFKFTLPPPRSARPE